ncbi:MAG: DUF3185 domain-containing protein [Proteobacteria bacterium]|nr:DUF3185 domain-containing protein [Pseudomonadota bacterium]MBU4010126.1 DUF3185 domain-containing protein [Pseudomonadota bacterium]
MRSSYTLTGVLIVIGIAVFAYQGITCATNKKIVDIDTIRMTAGKSKTLPPIVGVIALVGGIVLLVRGNKKS